MADPITLSVATIATLVATKALEKTGGTLSDKLWEQAGKFVAVLKRRDPEVAGEIEQVAAESRALEPGQQAELIAKVEAAVQADPGVLQEAEAVAAMVKATEGTIVNVTKLAEQIGINIQGGYNPITIDKLFETKLPPSPGPLPAPEQNSGQSKADQPLTPTERAERFRQAMKQFPRSNVSLSAEAMRRENIYE